MASTKNRDSNRSHVDPNTGSNLVEPLLPPNPEEPVVLLVGDPGLVGVPQVTLNEGEDWGHGEVQDASCRNGFFALLFLLQVALVMTLAILAIVALAKGDVTLPNTTPDEDDDDDSGLYHHVIQGLLFLLSLIGSILFLSATLMMLILGPLAEMMIQVSLVTSPITSGLASILALVTGALPLALLFAVMCLLSICYAVSVWHRIPFAAANVATAMEAIKVNKGLFAMAILTSLVAVVWTILWAFAVEEVMVVQSDWVYTCETQQNSDGNSEVDCYISTRGKWILIGLLLCLYWTSQVIKNVFHTTIAGVVGTWWFTPAEGGEGGGGNVLFDAWVRSSVYSLGSICLGSLLVAIMQVLQFLVGMARQERDEQGRQRRQNSLFWCILQCLVDNLENLMEYVNQWSFVYVGLYGYDYWTAGSKVHQLFQARGWSVILNDHLVGRSLGMMQLLIGIISGGIGVILGLVLLGFSLSPIATFFLGWVLGVFFSNILFGVVTSAVGTVVVCFAEAPRQLEENHPPELSERMIRAWRVAYPLECGF